MPFITEEIWQKIPHEGISLMVQEFPSPQIARQYPEIAQKMQDLMDLTGAIRSLRAEMNIDPKRFLKAKLVVKNMEDKTLIAGNMKKIQALARLSGLEFCESISGNFLRGVATLGEFGLDVQDAIDIPSERNRLQREMTQVKGEIDKIRQKINSRDFLARAPEEVVAENQSRHEELLEKLRKLESNLSHLPLQ